MKLTIAIISALGLTLASCSSESSDSVSNDDVVESDNSTDDGNNENDTETQEEDTETPATLTEIEPRDDITNVSAVPISSSTADGTTLTVEFFMKSAECYGHTISIDEESEENFVLIGVNVGEIDGVDSSDCDDEEIAYTSTAELENDLGERGVVPQEELEPEGEE